MATALPAKWGDPSRRDRRDFWTKRRKTALSLVAVMTMMAGIAVAFKLFDQVVPNNVVRDAANFEFAVDVFRSPDGVLPPAWLSAGGGPGQVPIFADGVEQFPGDSRTQDVRVRNTNLSPKKDATFFVYIDQASIDVGSIFGPVLLTDPGRPRFLSFWTLSIEKEKVLQPGVDVNENDHSATNPPPDLDDHDKSRLNQRTQVCRGGLREITRTSPCNLSTVRSAGSAELGASGTLQPTDTRWYRFTATEVDDGTDQSPFKGWFIKFTLVFQARVPALAEPGLER